MSALRPHRFVFSALTGALLAALLASPAAADYAVQDNIAFNAKKINPYTGGEAFEITKVEELLNESFGPVTIGPLTADPASFILEALFGVELPNVVKLKTGASLSGQVKIDFGYYVTGGRLDISYPASASLNFETVAGTTNTVRAGQSYGVDGAFMPGVTQRTVHPQFLQMEGGPGYFTVPSLQSFTDYNLPGFTTTSPSASAWVEASADVKSSIFTKVTALGGLLEWRKDISAGGQAGGRLVEIDPTGLYVAGQSEPLVEFNIFEPIGPIPIPAVSPLAELTFQVPNLAVSSTPPTSSVIVAHKEQPLVTLTGNLERLIPFIGPLLENSIGPLGYDLLNLSGGPQLSLYQDMTFTPHPKVQLAFSEPVLVQGTQCGNAICGGAGAVHQTFLAEFDLDGDIQWTPTFSNSTSITVTPTYILKNEFVNTTGLNVNFVVDVDALSLTGNFPPFNGTLGPIFSDTISIPLFQGGELFSQEFEIPIGAVTGGGTPGLGPITAGPITFQKSNIEIVSGHGDMNLTSYTLGADDPQNPGYEFYDLEFTRTVDGGAPQIFLLPVSAQFYSVPIGIEDGAAIFTTLDDVILTDPDTNQSLNLGRNFCYGDCDFSEYLPDASPGYFDPLLPDLGTLYLSTLPDDLEFVPGVDVDATGHPILGQYNADDDHHNDELGNYDTEFVDHRNGPTTTILARTGDLPPEGFAQISLIDSRPVMNDSGSAMFLAYLNTIPAPDYSIGLYLADGSDLDKVARNGDSLPSGGGIISDLGDTGFGNLNNSGQSVFRTTSGGFVILRTESDGGFTEIVRTGQAVPEGGDTFGYLQEGSINEAGQIAFLAFVEDPVQPLQRGIYVGDGQSTTKIVRIGDTLPGLTAPVYSLDDLYSFNDLGEVAFSAGALPSQGVVEQGIFVGDGSSVTPIAMSGMATPNGATFGSFNGTDINDAGEVAFFASVETSSDGLVVGIYKSDSDGITEIALNTGQQFGPAVFKPVINERGDVAFGSTSGIYLHTDGALEEIVLRSQSTPDGTGRFQSDADFNEWRLNDEGQVAFAFDIFDTVELQYRRGIYVHDGTNLVEVARTGQELAGRLITGLSIGGINDQMQVLYHAYLDDGRQVIARFEPSLYWSNLGNGDWATAGNWSLGVEPTKPYDVFIIAENAFTVTGPVVDHTIKSLTLGGDDTASAMLDLVSGTTLTATKGTTIRPNGVLAGYGALAGNVTSNGTIRVGDPGAAPTTTMNVDGDVVLEAGSRVELDIQSTSLVDKLAVAGAAMLDGELAVSLVSVTPLLNDSFEILTAAGGVDGQFDMTVTDLPDLASGLGWLIDYDANSVALQVVVETPGDFSSNGIVGPEDYLVWVANFGSTTNNSADANGDGIVNAADFTVWRDHLGQALGSGSGATGSASAYSTVPEPTVTVGLLTALLAAATLMPIRRR